MVVTIGPLKRPPSALRAWGSLFLLRAFLARLDASRAILGAVLGRPNYDAIVKSETEQLVCALVGIEVRGSQAAKIIQAVKSSDLPPSLEETVIGRVAELLASPPACAPAAPAAPAGRGGAFNVHVVYQDFTSIVDFIPQKVWKYCADTKCGIAILKLAVGLGLRRGTEHTYKTLCLSSLVVAHGLDYAQSMDPAVRVNEAKRTKSTVLQLAACAGVPMVLLHKLPPTAAELKISNPELYASVYESHDPPIPNPMDPTAWAMLVSGTKCRRDAGTKRQLPASSSMLPPDAGLMYAEMQSMRNELRLARASQRGDDIQLTFPCRSGQRPMQALDVSPWLVNGSSGMLALPPAQTSTMQHPSQAAPHEAPSSEAPPPEASPSQAGPCRGPYRAPIGAL